MRQRPGHSLLSPGMGLEKGAHPQKQRRCHKIMAEPVAALGGEGNRLGGGGSKVGDEVHEIACPTGQIDCHSGWAWNFGCAQQKAQNEVAQQPLCHRGIDDSLKGQDAVDQREDILVIMLFP